MREGGAGTPKSHIRHLVLLLRTREDFGPKENNMENLAIVVVFALALVAIVALGRGVRGKFGGIEISTQEDSTSRSKKTKGNVTPRR